MGNHKGVDQLSVTEIFSSISGEVGLIDQGSRCTFVRFAGCNLRCPWCDAKHSLVIGDGAMVHISSILDKVQRLGHKGVILTGGEPLFQSIEGLVCLLRDRGHVVQIETDGTYYSLVKADCWVIDYKLPSSRAHMHMMDLEWYLRFLGDTYLKFVCMDRSDFDYAMVTIDEMCSVYKSRTDLKAMHFPKVAFSPVHGVLDPSELYEWMAERSQDTVMKNAILNIQVHKYAGMKECPTEKVDRYFAGNQI